MCLGGSKGRGEVHRSRCRFHVLLFVSWELFHCKPWGREVTLADATGVLCGSVWGASTRNHAELQEALSGAEEGFPEVHVAHGVLREVAANPLVLKLEATDETVLTLGDAKTVVIDPSADLICDDFSMFQSWKASQMGSATL